MDQETPPGGVPLLGQAPLETPDTGLAIRGIGPAIPGIDRGIRVIGPARPATIPPTPLRIRCRAALRGVRHPLLVGNIGLVAPALIPPANLCNGKPPIARLSLPTRLQGRKNTEFLSTSNSGPFIFSRSFPAGSPLLRRLVYYLTVSTPDGPSLERR